MDNILFIKTKIGKIGIQEDGSGITAVFFENELPQKNPISYTEEQTPLLKKAAQEILEYLDGDRKSFTVPLSLKGTAFQQADWKALLTIPYGETRSYQEIAEQIGKPKACRAVGNANNKNPVSIVVPCHRVIGKNGRLTGYGGGLDIKKFLLDLERQNK